MFRKLFFLIAFVVLAGLAAAPSIATDYYVAQNDPAADDANPGTEVLPWETLKKACNTLVAGDTVYVKAGTYIDPTNSFRVVNNGTAGNPITFISSPQLAAVVRSPSLPGSRGTYAWSLGPNSSYVIVDGFKIEGGIVAAYDRATNCTLRNLELIYGWCGGDPTLNWGITLYWADYCVVENCYVHDLESSGSTSRNTAGIMLFGDPDTSDGKDVCEYNIFQGNTVDAGFNVRNAYGIKAGYLNNNTWRYNVALNASVGYHTMGSTSGEYNSSNNHYYQNIAIGCGAGFDAGYAVDHSYIYNNTAVDCDSFYTSYYDSVTDIELWNNILEGNNDIVIEWPGYPGIYPFTHLIAFSNYNCFYDFSEFAYREKLPSLHYYTLADWQNATSYDMDTITSNPLLVGGGDYSLDTGSPCIDAGVDLQDYDDDENTTESINMGAYITGNETIGHDWGATAPTKATSPNPANSATDVSVTADLSWTAGSGSTSSDVYFGTDSTPDSGEFQGNQTATTFDPGTMSNSTTYYWRIDEINSNGTTTGDVWSFTTASGASPPGQASSPNPANSATDVSTTADLSWTAGSGATSRDVYFGTSSPGSSQGNQTATTFDTGTMSNNTTYYWRIDEVNAAGTTTGTVWSFTTIVAAPGQASSPSPANSATGVSITADLSWTAGSGATSHDVYFGTSSPGSSQGNQTATTFDPGTLSNDTTYYWRIDEVNEADTTTGTVWTFTTVESGGQVIEEFGDATNTDYPGTIEDTYTNVGSGGDDNWSTDVTLNTYTWPVNTIANTTIIDWDLTDIPTDANVTEATLYLYQVDSSGDSSYDIGVHKITGVNPGITTCTWNTYDGTNSWTGGADGGQSDIASAEDTQSVNNTDDQYKTWDVTDMVADWVATPANNYGMLVNSDDVASVDSYRFFASTDVNDSSTRPKLIVTYSTGAAAPGAASSPSPANSATDVSITADLSWTAGSGATSHDVYFGTSSPGASQGNQTATTFDTGTMDNDTIYYWRIDEVNANGTTTGTVWSFTTIVAAPGTATSPSPANSATGVSITADLSWSAGSGATSRDVYFGTTSPGTSQGNQTATTFDSGTMTNNTTYYWRIDEINAAGTTTGTVWSFTTIVAAPSQASSPSPADSATYVSITTDLSWSAGAGATSRDVYFGTTSPGTSQGNQTATTFDTGTMTNNTTYYWRIDEVNAGGTTTGSVWSFTTIVAAPGAASSPSPSNSATGVSITAHLSWTAGSGATSHDVYFGTSSPGTSQGNQTATTFDTGTMTNNTIYYWRIDEVNAATTTTGTVWSFTTEQQVTPDANLVGWWRFENNADDSAGTNDGTIYGAVDANGKIGQALSFDEVNDYVTVPDFDYTNSSYEFSLSFWFKISDVSGSLYQYMYSHGNITADNSLAVYFSEADEGTGGEELRTWITLGDSTDWYSVSDPDYVDGQWHLYTITVSSVDGAKIYVDANSILTDPNLKGDSMNPASSIYIGARNDLNADRYYGNSSTNDGLLDDIRLYDRALSQSDISSLFTGGITVAHNPSPADSAADVSITADLSWTPGDYADTHDVYLGTDANAVADANNSSDEFMDNVDVNSYDPCTLDYNTTYYWAIDEVNDTTTWAGDVWSFTTVDGNGPVTEEFGDAADTNYPGSIADTYTNVGSGGDDNWSTDTTLNTYTWPADTIANTTIINWDLTDIPTDANVTEATLYLYQVESSGDSSYDVGVHKITGVNPGITTCTWNTYDGTNSWTGGADGGQSDIAAAEDTPSVNLTDDEYKTWDVTDMVADWVATPSSNYGMLVNSDDDASVDSYRFFAATDANDSSTRPKLIVTYSD